MQRQWPNSLQEWLAYQEQLHPRAIDLGLARVSEVLKRLGWTGKPSFKVVTVGGTNGKGSCVTTLETAFLSVGINTGAYVSPHLLRYNERIRLNGQEVDDQKLCTIFSKIEKVRGNTSLTYFEYGTLAALEIFKEACLDVVFLEVGLGGRLDATNVLDADVAVVTTIALDHQEWLGSDRESIGKEKSGIFRTDHPAICGDPDPPNSLIKHAEKIGARLYVQGRDFGWCLEPNSDSWSWWGLGKQVQGLPAPRLVGMHQYQNASTVRMVLALLSQFDPDQAMKQALQNTFVPGRFQILEGSIPCVLDVAHNPQAAEALAKTLHATKEGRTFAVVGILADKDMVGILSAMLPAVDSWHLVTLSGLRGTPALRLAEVLSCLGVTCSVKVHDSVVAGLSATRQEAHLGDRIVVFGSFHTVAQASEV
ncbi:Dihydrofolate synthase/folylpolyglutamate synthase [Gammaproteobacteria bacterium]